MKKLNPLFIKALNNLLKPGQLFTDPADCWLYSYDNGRHRGIPSAVVFSEDTLQVQAVIALCNKYRISITPRGRGTGTPGGAVPAVNNSIVLSFERMDKLIHFDSANKWLKAQSGCLNQTVQTIAATEKLHWPPDPGSSAYCTIGGNIAYNAGGPRTVKYGATREHVLGLTAVTGTGEIIHTGSYTTKGSVGYDLTRLLIGSEGTLAVITEAVLKLTPINYFRNSIKATYKNTLSAAQAAIQIMSQPHLPCALEFLDSTCVKLISQKNNHKHNINNNCILLIDIDSVHSKSALLKSIQHTGLIDIQLAKTKTDIKNLWASRKLLSQSLRKLSPKKISEDIVVPITAVPDLLLQLQHLRKKYKINIITFGHIGNGNLHVNLLPNTKIDQYNINNCLSELFDIVIKLNGTLSGEHGIGIEKKPYITKAIDKNTLQLMKNIKKIFDPNNILNPGKIF